MGGSFHDLYLEARPIVDTLQGLLSNPGSDIKLREAQHECKRRLKSQVRLCEKILRCPHADPELSQELRNAIGDLRECCESLVDWALGEADLLRPLSLAAYGSGIPLFANEESQARIRAFAERQDLSTHEFGLRKSDFERVIQALGPISQRLARLPQHAQPMQTLAKIEPPPTPDISSAIPEVPSVDDCERILQQADADERRHWETLLQKLRLNKAFKKVCIFPMSVDNPKYRAVDSGPLVPVPHYDKETNRDEYFNQWAGCIVELMGVAAAAGVTWPLEQWERGDGAESEHDADALKFVARICRLAAAGNQVEVAKLLERIPDGSELESRIDHSLRHRLKLETCAASLGQPTEAETSEQARQDESVIEPRMDDDQAEPDANETAKPRWGRYALGINHTNGKWHVFRRKGDTWEPGRPVQGVRNGLQRNLLLAFAEGEGNLALKKAASVWSQTGLVPRRAILTPAKIEISKINTLIRSALRIQGKGTFFVPINWRKKEQCFVAQIQIGHVELDDEGHLRFKLQSQL